MSALRGLLAGARDTRNGIDDDRPRDEARANGGSRRKRCGGRIAPGARNERRVPRLPLARRSDQIRGEKLGQAECGLFQQPRRRMPGRIPTLVDIGIFKPVVGRQIEHGNARLEKRGHLGHGCGVGHRQKDCIAFGQRIESVRFESKIGMAQKRGVQIGYRRAGQRIGGYDVQLEGGVLSQNPHKLDAGESGRPNDSRFYRHVCSLAHAYDLCVSCRLS